MVTAKKITITEDVLRVLSEGDVVGNVFIINRQLERPHYVAVNDILTRMGGKWDRKTKGHVFPQRPIGELDDQIRAILDTGTIEDNSHLGFFETPVALARTLVEMADVRDGHSCLEPSAGKGRIANELGAIVGWEQLSLCEIDPERAAILDGMSKARGGFGCLEADFLAVPHEGYDRVVMNPPFARNQDIAHVNHAWAALKSGGVLVSVMAGGVLFREDRRAREFRAFVETYGEMERLPEGSFRESGTGVHTVVVRLTKPE